MKKYFVPTIVLLCLLVGILLWLGQDGDVNSNNYDANNNALSETEIDKSVSFEGTDFVVKGDAQQLSVEDGRGYYYQSETVPGVYFLVNTKFSGQNLGDTKITGGDLYKVVDADQTTFETLRSVLDTNYWAKDKNKVYYRGVEISNVDASTFDLVCEEGCVYKDAYENIFDPLVEPSS